MKKRLPSILVGLLFLVGLGIMIYPTVSNQWNTYRQNKLISNYEKIVDDMSDEDFSQEWVGVYARRKPNLGSLNKWGLGREPFVCCVW